MTRKQTETGWRGSPDLWLNAAYETLLQGGVDAVKIQVLAKKLKLSRASFYWFFKDRDDLLDALIKRWRDHNTASIVQRSSAYADNLVEAFLNVCDCWFDNDLFDARFEFAVRSWALQSDALLAQVQAADEARIKALTAMFERFGLNGNVAEVSARAIYLVQIGYISMQSNEDTGLRMARIPQYAQVFTGMESARNDLDRFYARHDIGIAVQIHTEPENPFET